MDLKQKAREWLTSNSVWPTTGSLEMPRREVICAMADFAAQCVAEEREACAKERPGAWNPPYSDPRSQSVYARGVSDALDMYEKAIRARKDS